MDQWLDNIVASIEAELVSQQVDPTDVAYSTKRRMAYDARWPTRRQMEAHLDAANGDAAKVDLMKAEFAAIKAHPFFAKPQEA